MQDAWHWIVSDRSLPVRIAIGLGIFTTLAIVDYRAHRERATRWREYAFLFLCVLCAMAYGILNDLVTSRISIEYFLYGKGVAARVSGEVAANPERHRGTLDLEAMRIGTLATWSAGLIAGATLLVTNTLGRRPRLRMGQMLWTIPSIGVAAMTVAALGGWVGSTGFFTRFSDDFTEMLARDEMRPYRFMAVFGVHLGGYVGALLGLIGGALMVWRRRGEQFTLPSGL